MMSSLEDAMAERLVERRVVLTRLDCMGSSKGQTYPTRDAGPRPLLRGRES